MRGLRSLGGAFALAALALPAPVGAATSSGPQPTAPPPLVSQGALAAIEVEANPELFAPDGRLTWPRPFAPALDTTIEGINFDGNFTETGSYSIPPDPHGAAGPDQVVNVVNTSIEWFTDDGVLENRQSLASFFAPLSPLTNTFDPKVVYDQHAGRFVVVTLERTSSPTQTSRIFVGVSDSSDPNGPWHQFAINSLVTIGGAPYWADFPGLAVDEEAVYVTNNMFSFANAFGGVRLWVIPKEPFYSGGAATSAIYDPVLAAGDPTYGPAVATTMQPAQMFGLPSGATGTFLVSAGVNTGSNAFLQVIRVDNALSTPSFTARFLPWGTIGTHESLTSVLPAAPQSGTSRLIATNDRRVSQNAVWRDSHLYLAAPTLPPVGADANQVTTRWWKLDMTVLNTPTIADQGSIGGEDIATGTFTFFPSVAVDAAGNMAIGFAGAAPTIFPGAYYTGRMAADPAGTTQPVAALAAGTDYYLRTFTTSPTVPSRWGDYSGTALDPDGSTFWVFNEYAMTRGTPLPYNLAEDGRWATRWGSFRLTPATDTADLSLTKFDFPDPVGVGQPLDYTVTISNSGPDTATGVTVTDTLPSGVTFVSATSSQGTCSESSGVITCSLGSLAAFEGADVDIRVTPTSEGTLTNTASVTSDTADPNPANNTASETTTVGSGVDLLVVKGPSGRVVHPGSQFTYTISVNNVGLSPATGVQVTDPLPTGVTFVSATPTQGTCTQTSGTVTCALGAIGVDDEVSIAIVVQVPLTPGTITNTASATSNEADLEPADNSSSVTTTVMVSGAVISNGTVSLGVNRTGDLNYDCRRVGDPTCPAASAGEDVDPVGLRFVPNNTDGTSPGCLCEGWGMADAVSGLKGYDNEAAGEANITVNSFVVDGTTRAVSDVTISDPAIAGHQMRVVQDYHPSAASPNMYENTVTVTNTGANALGDVRYRRVMDWDVEPTAFSEWSTIQGSSPQLLFDSDDGFATADPLAGPSYINSEFKCGEDYTGACTFTDLGRGGEYPSATFPDDLGALFDFGFGSLAVGQSKTFRVFYGAAPDEPTAVSAIGSVGAEVYSLGEPNCPSGPPTAGCSELPANAGVEQGRPNTFIFAFVTTAGDLSITKSDSPDPVLVNGDLTYTLTVRNNGPDPVTAVQVSDTLPASVTHVSTTTTRGTCTGTTTISCSLGTMPNGATDTITIVVRPTAPGTLSNTATVTSPSEDVNPGNNTSTATTTVSPVADVRLTKTDSPDPVGAGSNLTYTLTVTNDGPNAAEGVTITDVLPGGVTFVSASAGCLNASGTVTCTIGTLAAGASTSRNIVVTPTAANPSLVNSATASATTADPNTGNNSASATTQVDPAADLSVTKSDSPDPVAVGRDLTYTLSATNAGPSTATGVTLSDTLPGGVTFVSAGAGCTEAGGTVTCAIGDLASGASASREIVVRASAPGVLSNTATASSATGDPNPANNSDTEMTTVARPNLTVSALGASPAAARPGQAVDLSWTTQNTSAVVASADWFELVYLSTDASLDPGDTALGSAFRLRDLSGGESYERLFGITTPSKPAGDYFLLVKTDGSEVLAESNESDNVFAIPFEVLPLPTLSIGDVSLAEGNSGTTAFVFTVTKSATGGTASVDFATADGTATAPGDYAAASGTLTFGAAETTKTITVNVSGDTAVEPAETFLVNLANASGATIADGQGVGTIENDDVGVSLTIDDVSQVEGNFGTTAFVFTVTKSGAGAASVDFATANGSATSAGDYTAHSGTLEFGPAETTKTVTVLVSGDTTFEANETFTVGLTNAIGATIADPQGVGTIQNDDAAPTLAIDDVSLAEGNSGTTAFSFTVTKTGATELPANVDFASANGTATQPSDYAAASGTLTFTSGEATKTITVSVNGDLVFEADQTFLVNLANVSGATIADGQGLGTIQNDDSAPTLTINDLSDFEPTDEGAASALSFTVTRNGATELPVTVDFDTVSGTASEPADYLRETGTLNITAVGPPTRNVNVDVFGDSVFEADETLFVNLSNATGATIVDGQGLGTILNDDAPPSLAIDDVNRAEGNSGTTAFVFTVTKTGATALPASVDFATTNGSATQPGDYAAQSGTFNFTAGETTKTITVLANGDGVFEADETFGVNLTNVAGATISDNQGEGTIQNDDAAPSLAINDVSLAEGNSGSTAFLFTVTKTGATAVSASVDFATANGTATAPGDYAAQTGPLNFAVGETTKTITVLVNGDVTFEANESFSVNLANAAGATVADNQGVGTIENDDTAPTLAIADRSQAEGNSGTTAFAFTVTKTGATELPASVDFATANGTADAGDYAAQSGARTFAPGETTKTITVLVNGDTTLEPNETFLVNLTNAGGATISDNQGVGTIENDDAPPTLAINDVSRVEGNVGTTEFVFTVTKTGATTLPAGVDYATANGSATQPGDYAAQSGTLNFAAGETTKTITVLANGDTASEPNESFLVNLTNASGATISDNQGVGTIENDDTVPTLAIDDVTHAEGNSGATAFTFTVTKSPTGIPASVDFATANGTAGAPGDYAAASGTLTFGAAETTKTITVDVNGDAALEPNETFTVNLTNVSGATIADGEGLGTIENDDGAPTLSINDVSQAEGNSGTTAFAFTVTKTGATELPASVDFATANGTASAPGDYAAQSGSLSFAAGETSKTITVLVVGGTTTEPDETFFVNLANAGGATIADGQGVGTIVNDDGVIRPPQGPRCVVPNVKGKTIGQARKLLVARKCRLGTVGRAYSSARPRGRIISQSRAPGARLPVGTRVNVVVSRGRRPRR